LPFKGKARKGKGVRERKNNGREGEKEVRTSNRAADGLRPALLYRLVLALFLNDWVNKY